MHEEIAYGPAEFSGDHGGRTKRDLLRDNGRGWDVLIVEGMDELPFQGRGRCIGGRRQCECGRSAVEYVRDLPHDEVGWTPECYVVRFLDAMERSGTVLDYRTHSFLIGSYLPQFDYVPGADWTPIQGLARLGGSSPDLVNLVFGARVAARVL